MSIMSMRERGQGFGTKVIIGLIIIAFAFFGLGSITTFLTPVARVASVNGDDVTASEMEVAVERNRRMFRVGHWANCSNYGKPDLDFLSKSGASICVSRAST